MVSITRKSALSKILDFIPSHTFYKWKVNDDIYFKFKARTAENVDEDGHKTN